MTKYFSKSLTAFVILICFGFLSCSKDEKTAPAYTLQGTWVGMYGVGTTAPATFYSLGFTTGGNIAVAAGSSSSPSVAVGTWTQLGDSVKATYTYQSPASGTYSLAAKFISSSNTMNGTWGAGTNAYNGGTFTLTKQ
jgi:hypothetical protein